MTSTSGAIGDDARAIKADEAARNGGEDEPMLDIVSFQDLIRASKTRVERCPIPGVGVVYLRDLSGASLLKIEEASKQGLTDMAIARIALSEALCTPEGEPLITDGYSLEQVETAIKSMRASAWKALTDLVLEKNGLGGDTSEADPKN